MSLSRFPRRHARTHKHPTSRPLTHLLPRYTQTSPHQFQRTKTNNACNFPPRPSVPHSPLFLKPNLASHHIHIYFTHLIPHTGANMKAQNHADTSYIVNIQHVRTYCSTPGYLLFHFHFHLRSHIPLPQYFFSPSLSTNTQKKTPTLCMNPIKIDSMPPAPLNMRGEKQNQYENQRRTSLYTKGLGTPFPPLTYNRKWGKTECREF